MGRKWIGETVLLAAGVLSAAAQIPNIRVNLPTSTNPEEVVIAVNPVDPTNLIAGANINYHYRSDDAGLTWTQGRLTSSLGVYGDPCVVFDALGNAFYGHLSNPQGGSWLDRIVVQKSTDGGATWDDGVGVGLNGLKDQDKEWLAVDMTGSPYRHNLYMAWTEFDVYGSTSPADSTRILFARSTNSGTSWSSPVRVSDAGGNCVDEDSTVEGAVPAVGPNGEVYLAWAGPLGIMFDRSTDGGVTWGRDIFVTDQPGGWDYAVPGIFRCNGLPVTACDVSPSRWRGTVYVLWADQRNGLENTDVFLIRSTDGGLTWGGLKKVNDDITLTHQFFPWLAIDQSNGNLYSVFYDRRGTTGVLTEVYVAKSTDGGSTFQNFKVSESPFFPTASIFFGDYTGIAADSGKVFPIWMRLDTTRLSVWTAPFDDTQATGVGPVVDVPRDFLLRNYPNPFNPSTTIVYWIPSTGAHGAGMQSVKLSVYDVLGREVARLADGLLAPGKYEALFEPLKGARGGSGVYFVRLESEDVRLTARMIMVK